MAMTVSSSKAKHLLDVAYRDGLTVLVRDYSTRGGEYVIEVSRSFDPSDVEQYRQAERDTWNALSLVPVTKPGSTWGSTSDNVGGHAALMNGRMYLCKSGVSVRFAKALIRLLGGNVA